MKWTLRFRKITLLVVSFVLLATCGAASSAAADLASVIRETQPKVVKIYGGTGRLPRAMEAYQSGFLISSEGHVLTAWSYVLDTDYITVTLDDGRKFEEVELLGADPPLELAGLEAQRDRSGSLRISRRTPSRSRASSWR
ncbi:MAG: hypothetical protein QM775_17645 [Pirellulales bacterium]